MAGDKSEMEIVLFDFMQEIIIIKSIRRTSEVWAAHFMVTLTPADTSAHVIPGDTGVGAGVVGEFTNILTVLIRIVTLQGSIGVVTVNGHGQRSTFIAEHIACLAPLLPGAASPGWDAALLLNIQFWLEWV